jgi:ketosteroid isomerase-like protein
VRRTYEGFNTRDFDRIHEVFHPDAEVRPALFGGGALEGTVFRGLAGIGAFLEVQAETWESAVVDVVSIRELGRHVLAETDVRAVGRSSGVALEAITWNVFELRDGKVARLHVFRDEADALESMGSMSQENAGVVGRFLAALISGEMEAVLAEVGRDVEVDDLDITLDTDRYRGHDGFLRWLSVWNESWESWRIEGTEIVPVDDECVIAMFVMFATGKGSSLELSRPDAATFKLRDGKIVEIAYYNDQHQAREAVGL